MTTIQPPPPSDRRFLSPEEIENRHAYHPPQNNDVVELHSQVREGTKELAHWFNDHLPECPEKTIALNKLREAMMYANAAIACRVVVVEPEPEEPQEG